MPKDSHRRRSSAAARDTRPSFARPPGAARASPVIKPSSEQKERRSRNVIYDDDDDEDDDDDDEDSHIDSPQPPPRRIHREKAKASPAPSPEKQKRHSRDVYGGRSGGGGVAGVKHKRKTSAPVRASPRAERERDRERVKYNSGTSTGSASGLLSTDALAKLNALNEGAKYDEQKKERRKKEKQYKNVQTVEVTEKRRRKSRNVSGAILEEGRGTRPRRRGGGGTGYEYDEKQHVVQRKGGFMTKKKWFILIGVLLVVLLIIIIAAVVASNKKKSGGGGGGGGSSSGASIENTCDASNIPATAKGTYTDVSTWMDTTDFNCTYTEETVGGLSVMGLSSTWDDSAQANPNVPALNQAWDYTKNPVRGTNIGGWLDLEPFITPSFFNYPASDNVVDEYTLSQKLGQSAARTMENHYATFITKADFAAIAAAGLDHVRIPYPYWAVTTYEGDPYVPKIAWRYLLRGIEYAREHGIRVNLDLHCAPGSQNGWAHSGRQGSINWIAGPDGAQNAQRTLDIHDQLSQFFAQDRYKNVVHMYGLINEPYMLTIDNNAVLEWNKKAIAIVRKNGVKQEITFHDGFLTLTDWDDMFKNVDPNLLLDTHQYQIFNVPQLKLTHQNKIKVACSGWAGMIAAVNNPSGGWGPTIDGEWSQADTDCTPNLNNVTAGSRWAGTYNTGDPGTSVLTQSCASPPCSCSSANADPSTYSAAYKQFLKMFAEAQMYAFEQARGWFYWTWKTENAAQWSWKLGLQAGILPAKAYAPDFKCDSDVPNFSGLSESY